MLEELWCLEQTIHLKESHGFKSVRFTEMRNPSVQKVEHDRKRRKRIPFLIDSAERFYEKTVWVQQHRINKRVERNIRQQWYTQQQRKATTAQKQLQQHNTTPFPLTTKSNILKRVYIIPTICHMSLTCKSPSPENQFKYFLHPFPPLPSKSTSPTTKSQNHEMTKYCLYHPILTFFIPSKIRDREGGQGFIFVEEE